jgi:acetyl esterase/lipase
MKSWQSYVFSYFLRRNMKRREPLLSDEEGKFVAGARKILNSEKFVPKKLPDEVSITEIKENDFRGDLIEWQNVEPKRTIIYFHGGGYIAGSPRVYRQTTLALAKIAQAKVFAVDYRLAPEHRFPAAVEDGLAAYKFVLQRAGKHKIAFVGDSAGGGLLLATMLAAREENLPLPSAAVCYSPFTDLAATGESLDKNNRRCAMFYGNSIRRTASVYLGDANPKNPLASPLHADFRDFPPLQIFVSSSEVLLDDSVRLAEKAVACGVNVDLQIWRNLPHVWAIFANQLPEARRALQITADFIAQS